MRLSRFKVHSVAAVGASVLSFLVGCSQPITPAPPTNHESLASREVRYARDYPGESDFRSIASSIPNFAGYTYEKGTNILDVFVTDLKDGERARGAVAQIFADVRRVGRFGPPRIVIKQKKYSFLQLEAWRDPVDAYLSTITGVNSLDLNEENNTLDISINDPSQRAGIVTAMRRLGLPDDAYVIQDVMDCGFNGDCSLDNPTAGPGADSTKSLRLTSKIRPLEMGTRLSFIALTLPRHQLSCTIGFVGHSNYLGGDRAVVTASHCGRQGHVDSGLNYSQPDTLQPPYGHEAEDPPFEPCDTVTCRASDANLSTSSEEVSARIARPYGPPGGVVNMGDSIIDVAHPFWEVAGIGTPAGNEIVDKVGIGSGWSEGALHITCETRWIMPDPITGTKRKLTCQYTAQYMSIGGDSGAPTFRINADGKTTLLGINWGHLHIADGAYADAVFSPMVDGVEGELADLFLCSTSSC
jgi:hypothetical protein